MFDSKAQKTESDSASVSGASFPKAFLPVFAAAAAAVNVAEAADHNVISSKPVSSVKAALVANVSGEPKDWNFKVVAGNAWAELKLGDSIVLWNGTNWIHGSMLINSSGARTQKDTFPVLNLTSPYLAQQINYTAKTDGQTTHTLNFTNAPAAPSTNETAVHLSASLNLKGGTLVGPDGKMWNLKYHEPLVLVHNGHQHFYNLHRWYHPGFESAGANVTLQVGSDYTSSPLEFTLSQPTLAQTEPKNIWFQLNVPNP